MKKDKGVAGLTILLSLIVMLFTMGLLISIFSIMNAKMQDTDSLYQTTDSATITNEVLTSVDDLVGEDFAVVDYRGVDCVLSSVKDSSGSTIASGNYTQTNCHIASGGDDAFNNTDWNVTYTYTYLDDLSGAVESINETTTSIGGTTDWFDLFIVIGSMVVLILLVVIIVTAIRGSGMTGEGGAGANQPPNNNIGTA